MGKETKKVVVRVADGRVHVAHVDADVDVTVVHDDVGGREVVVRGAKRALGRGARVGDYTLIFVATVAGMVLGAGAVLLGTVLGNGSLTPSPLIALLVFLVGCVYLATIIVARKKQ